MKLSNFLRLLFIISSLALLGHYVWLLRHQSATVEAVVAARRYYCPMHPSVTSNQPGQCPICRMSLQSDEISGDQANNATTGNPTTNPISQPSGEPGARKIAYYRHPMGGDATSLTPMKDEMGMDFIPVYEDEITLKPSALLDGRAAFLLSEVGQQLIGVKKATAEKRSIDYEIKSSGRVAFDPNLFAAISDYRVAKEAARNTRHTVPSVRQNSDALVAAAKLKLQLLGISEEQIRNFESNSFDTMSLLLPQGRVWVYADVYEYELPYLKVGQQIDVDSPLFSTEHFTGKLVSISPLINPSTRTISIKADVADPKHLLKPDMFLTVRTLIPLGEQVVIPEDAVVHTGDADLVFLLDSNGHFQPRKISLGVKTKGKAIVLSGLVAGETVAAGANFLIDSESRLRAVVQNANSAQSTSRN